MCCIILGVSFKSWNSKEIVNRQFETNKEFICISINTASVIFLYEIKLKLLVNEKLLVRYKKPLFSISATSHNLLVFIIPMKIIGSFYGIFLKDFERQRGQKSHEQRRRRLEVSSTAGTAGSLPLKPLAQGVV